MGDAPGRGTDIPVDVDAGQCQGKCSGSWRGGYLVPQSAARSLGPAWRPYRGGWMHAVIRHYKGNAQLLDELARRTDEVEQLIRGVSGFVSYCLVRTADGGFSVSVFEDRAGTEESNRRAAEWIRQNAPQVAGSPPEVIEGEAILQLSS